MKSQALVTNLTFLPPEMSGSGPKKDDLAGADTFFVWCVLVWKCEMYGAGLALFTVQLKKFSLTGGSHGR